jgi:hypothetical protein
MATTSKILFGDYLNVTDEGDGVIRVDGCPPSGAGGPTDTYIGIIGGLTGNYAYYKLNEVSGGWADSSGNGHDLALVSISGGSSVLNRGVPGIVDEDDGVLALDVTPYYSPPGTTDPGANIGIGSRTDNFFKFDTTNPYTVLFSITPDFGPTGTTSWSWGIMGTEYGSAGSYVIGWNILVDNGTGQIKFWQGPYLGAGNLLPSISTVAIGYTWQVMCVWTGSEQRIYINGALDNHGSFDYTGITPIAPYHGVLASNLLRVGGSWAHEGFGGTYCGYKGVLDSVLIAPVDLSAYAYDLYYSLGGPLYGPAGGGSVLASGTAKGGLAVVADGASGSYWGSPFNTPLANKAGSYMLSLADAGKIVGIDNTAANTLTIPTNAAQGFPIGTRIRIRQPGTGQTTVATASGVTLHSSGGKTKLAARYAHALLVKVAIDTWELSGDITT